MPVSLSIKNVPDELAERLRKQAKRNHRSLQGELLAIVEQGANLHGTLTVQEMVAEARKHGAHPYPDSVEILREMRGPIGASI